MLRNKYFDIVKTSSSEAWKIRLWIIGLFVFLTFLILYSPYKPLLQYLGYTESTGCPFYTFAGFPCPTCGMGRGLWAIVNLDAAHIFYHNPSSLFLYSLTFLAILAVFIFSLFNYKVKLKKSVWNLWPYFILLVSVVWIINILFGHHKQ